MTDGASDNFAFVAVIMAKTIYRMLGRLRRSATEGTGDLENAAHGRTCGRSSARSGRDLQIEARGATIFRERDQRLIRFGGVAKM